MRINRPLSRAHRWVLSTLDELSAALGEESAISRLHTIHNTPASVTITVDTDPLASIPSYRLSWHWRSADQVVRGSGGFNNLTTMDQVRAVAEGAYEAFVNHHRPEEWRTYMALRLKLVREVENAGPVPLRHQPSIFD